MPHPHRSGGGPPAVVATTSSPNYHHQQQQQQQQRHASSPSNKLSRPPRSQPAHTPDELHFAKRTLQKLVQDSQFFPVLDKNNRVQTVRESELEYGSVIGKGGFCEVRVATLKYSLHRSQQQQHRGHYRSQHQQHQPEQQQPQQQKYAMKYLSPSKTSSSRVFQRGIADLAMEACFLSLLRHENIIGLHCVSEGSLEENYNCNNNNTTTSRQNHHQHQQQGGNGEDEIVMDAYGNLQVKQRRQLPSIQNQHLFGYFLLLDPLYETLTDRIERTYIPQILLAANNPTTTTTTQATGASITSSEQRASPSYNFWDRIRHKDKYSDRGNNHPSRQQQPNTASAAAALTDPNSPEARLVSRLQVTKAIASALKYLHDECHIIFRDIKPDNIGFYRRYHGSCSCGYNNNNNNTNNNHSGGQQQRGGGAPSECTCYTEITKLFDFGLAKELKHKYRKSHPAYPDQDTYKLTGCTGSRRYMAPEVCFSDPYNQKADVYSFGMLLYQVCSMVTPFDGFSMGKHEREVLRGGFRPDVTIPPSTSTQQQQQQQSGGRGDKKSKGRRASADANDLLLQQQQQQEQAILIELQQAYVAGGGGGGQVDAEKKNNLLALRTKRYWPKELPRLMEECWDYDMRYRPEMKEITYRIDRCIDDLVRGSGRTKNHRSGDSNSSRDGGVGGMLSGWPIPKFGGGNTPLKSHHDEACAVTMETTTTSYQGDSHYSLGGAVFREDHQHVHHQQQPQQQYQQQQQQYHHVQHQPQQQQQPAFHSTSNAFANAESQLHQVAYQRNQDYQQQQHQREQQFPQYRNLYGGGYSTEGSETEGGVSGVSGNTATSDAAVYQNQRGGRQGRPGGGGGYGEDEDDVMGDDGGAII